MPSTDVVVIGGGQAGIAMSAMLTSSGVDHVVLERDAVAARWCQSALLYGVGEEAAAIAEDVTGRA